MTIINIQHIDLVDDHTLLLGECSLERRDSLAVSPYTDGTLDSLNNLINLRDLIVSRGQVCREDINQLSTYSAESSVLQAHLSRYPSAFYTEDLSTTLYGETVASLESSVIKSVGETLSTITRFIGDHGRNAIQYVKTTFDEDTRANANIQKVINLVEYLEATNDILNRSGVARKVARDLKYVEDNLHSDYTSKWNSLKDAMSTPSMEIATLTEAVAIPVIEVYPAIMEFIPKFIEGLSKAKSIEDVKRVIKNNKIPDANVTQLRRWVNKHIPPSKVTKTEGIVTEFQALSMSLRQHIKSLENERSTRPSFKPREALKNMSALEWVTTKTIAEDILKRAESVAGDQERMGNEVQRLVKSLVVDTAVGQEALPVVLELLSIVRGFGALMDTIGVLTVVKANLINEQLESLSKAFSRTHQIIKDQRESLTVAEIKQLNDLILQLKSSL